MESKYDYTLKESDVTLLKELEELRTHFFEKLMINKHTLNFINDNAETYNDRNRALNLLHSMTSLCHHNWKKTDDFYKICDCGSKCFVP